LINHLSSKEEQSELLRSFKALDLDNDGLLSREELIIGYKKFLTPAQAVDQVDKIMTVVDNNNSGKIDYSGKK
jgi:Ca2+-binding EF-hand superfamily protein